MTNAEAWFSVVLRSRKPEGSLGRTAQDGHLDSHTAPELGLHNTGQLTTGMLRARVDGEGEGGEVGEGEGGGGCTGERNIHVNSLFCQV